jgi:hypothetical protein
MKTRGLLLCGAACLLSSGALAAIRTVGTGMQYPTVSSAIAASVNGDVIQVVSGTYTNDTATITTNITLEAIGGRVSMVATVPLANQKGILIVGTSTTAPIVTIDGFDFSGATTPAGNNGSGVLYQSGTLTLTHDSFHDNQDGLRGSPQAAGSILVDHCEFYHNGTSDGLGHNVYVGVIPSFTIQNSYSHDAIGGHEVKSRALNTTVLNNRLFDNAGTSSYSVDIPQSGNVTISGNIIQQGTTATNPNIVAYGEEAVTQNPGRSFVVSNNTFVNDYTGSAPIAVWNLGSGTATLTDNSFWGVTSPQVASGTNTQAGNIFLGSRPILDTTSHPYKTVYLPPVTLSVINQRLALAGLVLSTVAPGTQGSGGGGGVAFALVDGTGAPIVDGANNAITTQ